MYCFIKYCFNGIDNTDSGLHQNTDPENQMYFKLTKRKMCSIIKSASPPSPKNWVCPKVLSTFSLKTTVSAQRHAAASVCQRTAASQRPITVSQFSSSGPSGSLSSSQTRLLWVCMFCFFCFFCFSWWHTDRARGLMKKSCPNSPPTPAFFSWPQERSRDSLLERGAWVCANVLAHVLGKH